MTAAPAPNPRDQAGQVAEIEWSEIAADAPEMAATMGRYLRQVSTFLSPASVVVADNALRQLARWALTETGIETVAQFRRDDIEDFKVWLAARPGIKGRLSAETQRQRLRTLRAFFERIIEWVWPDAPMRNPVLGGDIPKKPEPLPKFLDDRDAARLMAAAREAADPRDRVVVELLARTGMRAGELAGLDADAVVRIGQARWLRIPLGKLGNDRYVPLHPQLVDLLAAWTATNSEWIRRHHRLIADHRGVLDRHIICRIVKASAGTPVCGSIPTSCATPWPPRPSTGACASKPSPPCSGIAPWR